MLKFLFSNLLSVIKIVWHKFKFNLEKRSFTNRFTCLHWLCRKISWRCDNFTISIPIIFFNKYFIWQVFIWCPVDFLSNTLSRSERYYVFLIFLMFYPKIITLFIIIVWKFFLHMLFSNFSSRTPNQVVI